MCGFSLGTPDFVLSNFPIYMGTTLSTSERDKNSDQKWTICSNCGCIQLIELIPLNELYSENHHAEVIGTMWEEHHNKFAEFVLKSSPTHIVEIGGAHGYLSKVIRKYSNISKYVLVDPDSNSEDDKILYIKGFIEDNLQVIENSDSIVHSHVLEHLYDPRKFFRLIADRMDIGAKMFISFPNIEELIQAGGANSLNFEHTYFLTPIQIEVVFQNYGFKINRRYNFLQHSFFYEIEKSSEIMSNHEIPNINDKSAKYIKMQGDLRKFVINTNQVISNLLIPTYVFGAHIFSQNLLILGLNPSFIQGVIDNAPSKQNQRLYGTELQVFNPKIIAKHNQVNVVLKSSHYQNEIKSQLYSINKNVTIIE